MKEQLSFEGGYANYHHPGLQRVLRGVRSDRFGTKTLGNLGMPEANRANWACSREHARHAGCYPGELIHGHIWPYMAIYGSYVAIYGPCMAIYGPYMVQTGCWLFFLIDARDIRPPALSALRPIARIDEKIGKGCSILLFFHRCPLLDSWRARVLLCDQLFCKRVCSEKFDVHFGLPVNIKYYNFNSR